MSLLANLKTDDSIANEKDTLGGARTLESGLYDFTVGMAYLKKSDGGALGLFLTLLGADKIELRQSIYLTSGDAKGNKNYYEKDGEKNYLPGFLMGNSLALLAVGKEISELDTEEKVVNLYNSEAKAEVPTKVQVVMDLLGKEITAGVVKQLVDKNVKDASGAYVASGETREENEIDKFFRTRDKLTTAEIRGQATEAAFYKAWGDKHTGQVRNKAKGAAAGGTAGAPKAGAAAGTPGTAKPGKSLFG